MKYLFADTGLAARRLEVFASVFRDSTGSFLRDAIDHPVELAIDLGCGPGFTTHQLFEELKPKRITGLDNSKHFVALARATEKACFQFELHDVTRMPLPSAPADVIYCRYLLAHLKNAETLVADWATQLRPGGLLLVDEVEWIETNLPDFRKYLDIVTSMLRSQGSELFIGPALDRMQVPGLRKTYNTVRRHRVTDRDAATMFSMNLPNWKLQPFIAENYPREEIDGLSGRMEDLARNQSGESHIEWGLRQIAFDLKG